MREKGKKKGRKEEEKRKGGRREEGKEKWGGRKEGKEEGRKGGKVKKGEIRGKRRE
jgi:hypothetical protein